MASPSSPGSAPVRVAVFASGGGTNFQALVDAFNGGDHPSVRVTLLVAGRAGIGAIERAERARIPVEIVEGHAPERVLVVLKEARVDWIVLAGYLRLVPAEVLDAFPGRVLNIHPALLPAFGGHGMYGRRVHEAVLASGTRVSGATVHRVDRDYDTGAIVAQWPVAVRADDTPETLAARVLEVEHRLLPAVVARLATDAPPGHESPVHFRASAMPPDAAEVAAGVASRSPERPS